MGIRGLETFLEKNDGTGCFPVNLQAAIEKARSDGENTTIVADGMSCLRYIYGDLPWTSGGQIKEFVENLQNFVMKFRSLGAEIVFYFDGPPAEVKIDQWKRRRLETMDKILNLLDKINAGVPASSIERDDWQVLPPNIGTICGVVLKGFGCKVIGSIGECDEEIARYAYQNRCLAILGQDTDFVVYPGARHYWSIKHFNIHNMTTLEYDGRKLASMLYLKFEQLPLLSTLLGNDIIQRDELKSFHNSFGSRYYTPRFVSFYKTVHNVAGFIRRYPSGDALTPYLRQMAQQVFHDERKWTLLQDSIQSYNITQQPKDDLECQIENEEWNAVLRLARDRHIDGAPSQLYGAIVRGIYNCSTCTEDHRLDDLPLNQVILRKLRQKIYGILLFDKPKVGDEIVVVRELAVAGPHSIDSYTSIPVIPPRVPHPGLVALWSSDDSLVDMRWALMCEAVDIDIQLVRDGGVPQRLTIFLLTLKYLMDEGMKLKLFELNALISSAVVLVDYNTHKLKCLPLDPSDTRAIRLYTLVARSYGSFILLNTSCGYPIPVQDALAHNYQDGKLFHQAYRMAKNGSSVPELCDYQNSHILVFNAILSILPVSKAVSPTAV